MLFARRSVYRAAETAQLVRTASLATRSTQQLSRRLYSNGKGQQESKYGYLPWIIGSIGLGGAIIFYLPGPGTHVKTHHDTYSPDWGREAKEAEAKWQGAPPSQVDEAMAMKYAGGQGSMSGKQEGLSNANTSNPFTTTPGKSKKGEGDTETAKLKGTVSTDRPQI